MSLWYCPNCKRIAAPAPYHACASSGTGLPVERVERVEINRCRRRDAEWMPCNCGPNECQEQEQSR